MNHAKLPMIFSILSSYPYPARQTLLMLFLLTGSLAQLSAQRTISGSVFLSDGEAQIGCAVSSHPGFSQNTVYSYLEGEYTITVPDTATFLYYNWDGTINPAVPIGKQDTINLINAYRFVDERVDYPKEKVDRSHSVRISGYIGETREAGDAEVIITPMVAKSQPLSGVTADEQGRFYLEAPPAARVLKVQQEWMVQYFVIPNVRSLYLPLEADGNYLSVHLDKKVIKRLKRKWRREQRKKQR